MWNYVCNSCGATLDPGEKCTCNEDRDERIRKYIKQIGLSQLDKEGQIQFDFSRMVNNG
jgi:hypothetical protein|nr:MAG TPA: RUBRERYTHRIN TRANSPORT, IRON, FERROXIDASE.1A [Bacteriophage sp.]DAY56245.1 MAG TPA: RUBRERYTHRIN TRANSPORT, IRON, FERROXIDASE.1A [Caudoviricetes sp.]